VKETMEEIIKEEIKKKSFWEKLVGIFINPKEIVYDKLGETVMCRAAYKET
jgi:hypothetical protein